MIKAVGLFSGGLDSALAIKLVQKQGIKVIALNFVSPFCSCVGEGCSIVNLAKQLKVPIKLMEKGEEYFKIIRHPKHGYGKGLNPCIDCKIFILKKAKQYAKKVGAKFIFTGEVLGQRPMSQHYKTLMLIEKEAGLKGKLVRPLCAKLLPPTEAEKKGWIDREKLLSFEGRKRVPQIDLAKKFKIHGFMCGGSGCRLTDKEFARKMKDLIKHKKKITVADCELLRLGRHFRYKNSKIIVGRDEQENKLISKFKGTKLEPVDVPGPTTLLQGKNIKIAAQLTAYYCKGKTKIKYKNKTITIKPLTAKEVEKLRI